MGERGKLTGLSLASLNMRSADRLTHFDPLKIDWESGEGLQGPGGIPKRLARTGRDLAFAATGATGASIRRPT